MIKFTKINISQFMAGINKLCISLIKQTNDNKIKQKKYGIKIFKIIIDS